MQYTLRPGAYAEKADITTTNIEDVVSEPKYVHEAGHQVQGQVEAAQLYLEDNSGKVLERLLVPRPTDDPDDPLNWSLWRKHLAFACVSFFVLLSNYTTASLSPVLVPIITAFNITETQASYLNTLNILFLGLGNLFWVPFAMKYGKRPILLICLVIFFVSCIWNACAKSFGSILASRIIQGFGASASEALGPAVVADLFFVHQRGYYNGWYGIMIAGGSSLGGIFGGLVTHANPNWRYVFWMDAACVGACLVANIFFLAETSYHRPESTEGAGGHAIKDRPKAKVSLSKALSVTGWHDPDTSVVQYFLRSMKLLTYPAMLWGGTAYGITLGFFVLQLTANATFYPSLYNFTGLGVGNTNGANLIGAVVGCLYGGPGSDWIIQYISRLRGGYFKPEFRLWALVVPYIFAPVGLLMWGFGMGNHMHWIIPTVGTSITYGVLAAVQTICLTYIVDGYRAVAGEAMTSVTAYKNTIAFALSFAVIPWIESEGYAKVGGYNLLIEGIIFSLAVPLYIYGERIRKWTSTRSL